MEAVSLLSCGHGPVMKVWRSKYFHGTGCQPFWWHLGCLHVELQCSSDKVVDFVLLMSAGQTLHVYTVHQQHNSLTELFPFSFLLVSLVCSYLFCPFLHFDDKYFGVVSFYLPYILFKMTINLLSVISVQLKDLNFLCTKERSVLCFDVEFPIQMLQSLKVVSWLVEIKWRKLDKICGIGAILKP